MIPPCQEHFEAWLVIIAIVCCTIVAGALLDRLLLHRRYRMRLLRQAVRSARDRQMTLNQERTRE